MTLNEKLNMLSGPIGLSVLSANPEEKRIGAGHVPGVPRLGIPDLWESDASLGVANGGPLRKGDVATALPSSLATAATFDTKLAFAGGQMIGAEARSKGFNVLLGGGANLVRDPWGGRSFEYLSEDVLLTGVLAGESIRGIQSNNIISTVKHFALNPQESGRYVINARLGEDKLRESDLLAFEIAIERGRPGSVMAAYNKVNGDWASENHWLLNTVLKRDWNYPGWVMSDWGSVHSSEKAALAGLDQQSGREFDKEPYFAAPLAADVAAGKVPLSIIDDKVLRILRSMFAHGLVDDPTPSRPQPIDYDSHGQVAQNVAEAGIVLLRNEKELLPLAASANRIAVIGGHADVGVLSGGGSSLVRSVGGNALEITIPGTGPFSGLMTRTYHKSSPLEAIRRRAPQALVTYSSGNDRAQAVANAAAADVVILFVEEWRTEVLDRETLSLPDGQDELVAAVAAVNPRTIVVLQTGGPVLLPWRDKVGALVEAWYPGQKGGEAIAAVLFGDVNPRGRLPVTFPATAAQAPRPEVPGIAEAKAAFDRVAKAKLEELGTLGLAGGMASFPVDYNEGADVGYRWYERNGYKPAYPFGYGLSYTTFTQTDLNVSGGTTPLASFVVANTGARAGVEVSQIYARQKNGPRVLVGFAATALAPGERREVQVALDLRPAQQFDTAKGSRTRLTQPITISLGQSSTQMVSEVTYLP